jgi:hypothetical protein
LWSLIRQRIPTSKLQRRGRRDESGCACDRVRVRKLFFHLKTARDLVLKFAGGKCLSRRSCEMKCFSPRLTGNRKSSTKPRSWLLALIILFLIESLMWR